MCKRRLDFLLMVGFVLPVSVAFVRPAFHLTGSNTAIKRSLFNFFDEGKKALVKKLAGEYDAPAVRSRINNLIKDNSVLMLSFTTCPYCMKAKAVLDSYGAKYTVVELDQDEDGKSIRAELGGMVGRTSVPAIWIGGDFIGGCNDGPMGGVVKLAESGELDKMLKRVESI